MTLLNQIGTLPWARRTGGRLSRGEREALLKQTLDVQNLATNESFPATEKGLSRVNIEKIRVPDSRTARHAEQLIGELGRPFLVNHCYRTYLWGSLLAQHDGVTIDDEEAFYVASLLHDLGLTDAHFCRHPDAHCFAVEGAFAAERFLEEEGWGQTRRDVVAEAITLHLNMLIELAHGAVAVYLSAGAKCDVVGARSTDVPQNAVEKVLRLHPGTNFAEEFAALLGAEAKARPESRIGFVMANLPPLELFPFEKR